VNLVIKGFKSIEEAEKELGHPTGVGKIQRGECPLHTWSPIGCTFCRYGHMLECHYPHTCEEARCSHYIVEEEYNEE
jgi:hypothetical protein